MLMVAMRDFGFDCLGCPDVIKESYVIRKQYEISNYIETQ